MGKGVRRCPKSKKRGQERIGQARVGSRSEEGQGGGSGKKGVKKKRERSA